jgi:3-hydroxymyristoyl/3-hydroxydecanoyl-(acyl carrier protein) dehydratase
VTELANAVTPLAGLDHVEAGRSGDGLDVVAVRRIRPEEPYLEGHYPGSPIFPGVFIVELVVEALRRALPGEALTLAEISSARFQAPVRPGAQVTVRARVTLGDGHAVRAEITSGDTRVATVQLRLAA